MKNQHYLNSLVDELFSDEEIARLPKAEPGWLEDLRIVEPDRYKKIIKDMKLEEKKNVEKNVNKRIMAGESYLKENKNHNLAVETKINVKKNLPQKVKNALKKSIMAEIDKQINGGAINLEHLLGVKAKKGSQYDKMNKGEGIFTTDGLQSVFDKITPIKERIESSIKGLVKGRRGDFAPYVKKIFEKFGNETITGIEIVRQPVQGAIVEVLNVLSLGKFGKRMKRKGFDNLFHLSLFITFSNGSKISLEKNEKINAVVNPKKDKEAESKVITNIPQGLTLNDLIEGVSNIQGDDLNKYSAVDNNCQDFCLAVLQGSNIGDESDYEFVKQDTEQLFNKYGYLKKIANATTDVAGKLNDIVYGAGIVNRTPNLADNNIVQSVVFEKSEGWTKPNAKKWLKANGYYYDSCDTKKTQFRFRQFNPKDLYGRYYISEKIQKGGKDIILVISMNSNVGKITGGNAIDNLANAFTKGVKPLSNAFTSHKAINALYHTSNNMNKANIGMINAQYGDAQNLNKLNPVYSGLKLNPQGGMDFGKLTKGYLMPAAVEVGKPVYTGTAMMGSTMLTGNPIMGKIVADELWNNMGGEQYDPSRNQKSKELGTASQIMGKIAGTYMGDKTAALKGTKMPKGKGILNHMPTRKRGRPKKVVVEQPVKAAKKRGRPRKNVVIVEQQLESDLFDKPINSSMEQLIRARNRQAEKKRVSDNDLLRSKLMAMMP